MKTNYKYVHFGLRAADYATLHF